MKNTILLILIINFQLSIFNSFGQNSFEGKIVMRTENPVTGEISDITWYMKNGQHKLNYVNSGTDISSTYSLVSNGGTLEMVNDGGKVAIDKSKLNNPVFEFPGHKLLNKEANKVMNEFKCIRYTIESGDKVAEVWMADDADLKISDFPDFMQNNLLSICENLHQGGIPVQITIKEKSGKLIHRQSISYIMAAKIADEKLK